MNRRFKFLQAAILSALLLGGMLSTACGGGGSGGGVAPSLMATFTPDATPNPMTVGMQLASSTGADFSVDMVVTGTFNDLFGVAFRVQLPASVTLTGFSQTGSVLLPGAPSTEFSAVQVGTEVLVVASRIQGGPGSYVPSIDIGSGAAEQLINLSFRADAATTGAISLGMPREVRTCNDTTEVCGVVSDGSLTWLGGNLVAN